MLCLSRKVGESILIGNDIEVRVYSIHGGQVDFPAGVDLVAAIERGWAVVDNKQPEFIEVCCSCGEGLCSQSEAQQPYRSRRVVVEPCTRCIDAAKSDGYDDGYSTAEIDVENASKES